MKFITLATAAAVPLAAALKQSQSGGAVVINQCNYDIPLKAIPAQASGIENAQESDKTLTASGGQFFTPFVQLLTAGGWSIKLNTIDSWKNIMQFEYTWADDNQIWYDNSFVDGVESEHPAWQFLCPDSPTPPHNNAYQHSTDDAAGMQKPVAPSATITLVLCPGETGSSTPAPSYGALPSSSEAPSSTQAPAPTTAPSTTLQTYASPTPSSTSDLGLKQANVQVESSSEEPTPSPTPADDGDVAVVTAYETKVVTAVVTETASPKQKRHAHRHPHGHSH